jgi:MerR family copper efflux transcriptional regulator
MSSDINFFPISEVTRLFDIRASALRYYEEIGLLKPALRRSGRRHYGIVELKRLVLIRLLQDAGQLSLTEIADVLGKGANDAARTVLTNRVSALERQIEAARTAKVYLEHRLTCPREDPVGECPVLDKQVSQWLDERLGDVPEPRRAPQVSKNQHSICCKRKRIN